VEEELADLLSAAVDIAIKKRVRRNGKIEEQDVVTIGFGSMEALNGLIQSGRQIHPTPP
jgi:ParB family chromosome partitioning protein